jgi:hypothetical protein
MSRKPDPKLGNYYVTKLARFGGLGDARSARSAEAKRGAEAETSEHLI